MYLSYWIISFYFDIFLAMHVKNGFRFVIGYIHYVNELYLINNTKEVSMLLLVLNSFLINVIILVTKKSAILLAWLKGLPNTNKNNSVTQFSIFNI